MWESCHPCVNEAKVGYGTSSIWLSRLSELVSEHAQTSCLPADISNDLAKGFKGKPGWKELGHGGPGVAWAPVMELWTTNRGQLPRTRFDAHALSIFSIDFGEVGQEMR